MICKECYVKLDTFHKFATMALKTQEQMTKLLCTEGKPAEKKSLLHSYLTKVCLLELEAFMDISCVF